MEGPEAFKENVTVQLDEQALHEEAVARYAKALEEGIIHNLMNGYKVKWQKFKAEFRSDHNKVVEAWRKEMRPELVALINEFKDIQLDKNKSVGFAKFMQKYQDWRGIYILDDKYFAETLKHVKLGSTGEWFNRDTQARDFDNLFGHPKKVGDFMKVVNKLDQNAAKLLAAAQAADKDGKKSRVVATVISQGIAEVCQNITRAIHLAR
jgi:hypothetical protein